MAIYRTIDSGQSDRDTHLDSLLIEKIRCINFYKPVHLILFPLLILQLTVLDPDSSERFLFFIKGELEHIVKTYILLLFSLLVSSIGYAQEENDIIYIQEGKWGVILCGERGYAWLDNKGDTIFGFGKLQEISADDDFNLVLAEKAL